MKFREELGLTQKSGSNLLTNNNPYLILKNDDKKMKFYDQTRVAWVTIQKNIRENEMLKKNYARLKNGQVLDHRI
jgi:hypothetical protein